MAVNFGLLQPVDIGGAFQAGFDRSRVQSALGALGEDPTNSRAIGVLAQYQPELAMRMQDRGRQQQFRQAALGAYDPQTGQINAPAMRSAFVGAGDIEGALRFDEGQAQAQTAQQRAARERLLATARLLDDATDEPSYQQGLAIARQMGMDVSSAPPQFDPAWVQMQRRIVSEFIQQPPEMTNFMREAAAAGIQPGTPEFRRLLEGRYAPQPRIITDPATGQSYIMTPETVGAPPPQTALPPVLSDEDMQELEEGGAGRPGPRTFP